MASAAAELHVTHGAVSKQIQMLEQELGAPLFERRNRGIHLTPSGRWLAERLEAVFADLHRTMQDFPDVGEIPGPLTISCEPTLCLRLLIPALADLKIVTGLDVRVLAAGGPVDFRRDQVDIAIRRSDFALPTAVETMILADERMGPVMHPVLSARDMETLPRLQSDTRPTAWAAWGQRHPTSLVGPVIPYEHFYLAIQAAEAGQGMAMASIHMVADALNDGRLHAPYGFLPDGTRYVAIWPTGQGDDRRDALIAWLRDRMTRSLGE
ncbi:DNA-binding transcriptional LysR family regulator [Sphingomonas leidyi]|uniref:DNA-binding transcriptional LysR family regulator n=2 Tax=Sphingomonas leidyi TaxID=68569 RepID=A0A7X5UXQ7_9SPHN|nr:DNA-binding transcriptional LysR family regulator [Sphingomonas leidyi]